MHGQTVSLEILCRLTLYQTIKLWTPPNRESVQTTILNLIKNGRKFSNRVENIVGKGEIAYNEQFLLFPQCFHRTCTADM